jgi:prolyl-tRNA synthetase
VQDVESLPYSVHAVRVRTDTTNADQQQATGVQEWIVIAPKGRHVNELKVKAHIMRHALSSGEIVDISVHPVAAQTTESDQARLLVDESLVARTEGDRAASVAALGDFTLTEERDACAEEGCHGELVSSKGIEVGHVFYLGTKYSAKLDARVATPTGTNFAEMVRCPRRVCCLARVHALGAR